MDEEDEVIEAAEPAEENEEDEYDDGVDPVEEAIDNVVQKLCPKALADAVDDLLFERDESIIAEMKRALKATEVAVVKEALAEADFYNLSKHRKADACVSTDDQLNISN
jgi:hypothetical protein